MHSDLSCEKCAEERFGHRSQEEVAGGTSVSQCASSFPMLPDLGLVQWWFHFVWLFDLPVRSLLAKKKQTCKQTNATCETRSDMKHYHVETQ